MPTKIQLSDALDKMEEDLTASESYVEKQIVEIKELKTKITGQIHGVTDLKDQNKKLRKINDESTTTITMMDATIKEYQQTIHGLRKGYAGHQTIIVEAEAAMELGLQLFYPEALADQDAVKDPKARLLLRVFDILGKVNV